MLKNIIKSSIIGYFNIIDKIKIFLTRTPKRPSIKTCNDQDIKHLDPFWEEEEEAFIVDDGYKEFPYHASCMGCHTNKDKCINCCCYDFDWSKEMLASESKACMSSAYHNFCIETGNYYIDNRNNLYLGNNSPKNTVTTMSNCILGGLENEY